MANRTITWVTPVLLLLELSGVAGRELRGQTQIAQDSVDTRFQLDCHVPEAVLKTMLPPGFTSSVATGGPAKDANLRVIFVDQFVARGPGGKAMGTGSSQFVTLVAPVKDAQGAPSQLVIGGLSKDSANAPGPFGVYLAAGDATMHRSVTSTAGPVLESQDWAFTARSGEHVELHIKFERGAGFRLGPMNVTYYSAKAPTNAQIVKQEQDLDILRNTTTLPPDRVKAFSFKVSGGSYARLFDGSEKLLSWDNILWLHQTVSQP